MNKLLFVLCFLLIGTLNAETQILAIGGSTRIDSVNKKLAREAAGIAKELGANATVIDLKDYPMPFYDADLESSQGMPENGKKLRRLMIESQVIIIATPNYNHSIPAVLKNAIDWASRSEEGKHSRDAFLNKKFILLSASPGKSGGAEALVHLRDILSDQKAIIQQKEISIPNAYKQFNQEGNLINLKIKDDLTELIKKVL